MTKSELAVIILAAGQGTRMKSKKPKVLHELGGRSMLGHVLETTQRLDASVVRVIVRHDRERIVEALSVYPEAQPVDQDDIPGTGRAVQVGAAALPDDYAGDVLVLSGDVPLLEAKTVLALIKAHQDASAAATLLTAVVGNSSGYGRIVRDDAGDVTSVVEETEASDAQKQIHEINAGVYVFSAPALRRVLPRLTRDNAKKELYLTQAVALLREDGARVAASVTDDPASTQGVNDRAQLADAAAVLRARTVKKWQAQGVTVLDPATTWIDDTVSLAQDVTVLPNSFILGATTIAEGVTIGPDTSIVDSEVREDATIRRSEVTTALIGPGAKIGPFTYIRPGTELGAGVKVGAYTEVKNSTVGEGTKIPHLSYIGDSEVGAGVNLGAGTITANYDDVNKHKTVIGDHVHTSSHTVLVAPVTLGDGSKTGAGAIVRKNVEAGALALSVAPQRNIQGWVEKNRAGTAAAEAAVSAANAEKATDGAE